LGPDERVVHQTVQNGLNSITIGVPDSVPLGAFFLRLRLSTQENLAPTGTAPDGEVEDYRILVDTPPVADAGGPYRIDAGQDLTLDARLSTDPDVAAGDGLVAYAWDLNSDGVYDWTTAQAVSTVPWTTLAGLGLAYPVDPDTGLPSNVVRLRVTDSFGAADFAVTSLTIVCPWHNADDPYDVNGIDGATALDVLIIINYINANPGDAEPPAPPASPPPYYDVNGDNQVTALDVLLVINDINAHIAGSPMGEAEATAAGLAAAPVLPPRNGISRRLSGCPAASQSPPWRFACPPAIWPEVTADLAASLTDDCPHPVSLIVRSPACRAWDGAATILENDWFDLAADVDLPGLAGEEELGRHLHHLNRRDPTATAKP
jgi:hypothetical protein